MIAALDAVRGGTLFSGIGAPELAMPWVDWRWCAEIERFPSAVHHARFGTPNLGDVTKVDWNAVEPVDLLVFGSPCQSFSVAGKRLGLDDARGNLALVALGVARRLRPEWLVFENVPGLLSSDDGRDFGTFLGLLGECGYGWAYRVLDAQFAGIPQRRRRVFVVGHLGDWRRAAAVLLEPESMRGDPPPRREAGEGIARPVASSAPGGSGYRNDADTAENHLIAGTFQNTGQGWWNEGEVAAGLRDMSAGSASKEATLVAIPVTHALTADNAGRCQEDGTGRGVPLVPVAFSSKDHGADAGEIAPTLRAGQHHASHANAGVPPAIAFAAMAQAGGGWAPPSCPTSEGIALPLDATRAQAIAFTLHGSDGTASTATETETASALRARAPGCIDNSTTTAVLAFHARQDPDSGPVTHPLDTDGYSVAVVTGDEWHADATQTRPHQALRALLKASSEEALCEWGLGILAAFWPAEVLRSGLHGASLRCPPQPERGLVNVALSRAKAGARWSVRDLWEAGGDGCPPPGFGPSEQLAGELGSYLSELPYAPSPAETFLRDLWSAAEGARLLRQTLSAVQDARRSACGEGQSARAAAVRRLTADECEALQGLPRGFTLISYRGKPAADGPRYRALGNSMAVPVVAWIGDRLRIAGLSKRAAA